MTRKTSRQTAAPLLTLAYLVLCGSATAQPDQARLPNIPEQEKNQPSGPEPAPLEAASELPQPYTSWQGTGPLPPRASLPGSLPLPEPRPRQSPRRPLELSLAVSAFLPNCGSGSLNDRFCLTVAPGLGAELSLLYRVTPYFAFGAEAALSGFAGRGRGWLSSSGGDARFFGAAGRVYFADDGRWDPYLALTLGAGALTLQGDDSKLEPAATKGLGARVAGGVDVVLGSHVRVGPSASFAHWVAWSSPGGAYGRMLGFATLGLRVTASLGEVL